MTLDLVYLDRLFGAASCHISVNMYYERFLMITLLVLLFVQSFLYQYLIWLPTLSILTGYHRNTSALRQNHCTLYQCIYIVLTFILLIKFQICEFAHFFKRCSNVYRYAQNILNSLVI